MSLHCPGRNASVQTSLARLVRIRPVRESIRTMVVPKTIIPLVGAADVETFRCLSSTTPGHDMQWTYREQGPAAGPKLVARLAPVGSVTYAWMLEMGHVQ